MELLGEWVLWNLVLVHLETVSVLLQCRCTVYAEHTIGSKFVLDAPDGTDEDITMLDTPMLWSFPSCNSSPTQLPRHPWIQQTRRHCFGHDSLIRHQNGAFLDALERGR
jgi:hypothetical protein